MKNLKEEPGSSCPEGLTWGQDWVTRPTFESQGYALLAAQR